MEDFIQRMEVLEELKKRCMRGGNAVVVEVPDCSEQCARDPSSIP